MCVNFAFFTYFHSYIYDRIGNIVIDFVNGLIIDKKTYDKLFCYKQINDLSYSEYEIMKNKTGYDLRTNFFPLFYLALSKFDADGNDIYKSLKKT